MILDHVRILKTNPKKYVIFFVEMLPFKELWHDIMTSSIHQIFFGSTSWVYRVLVSNLLQSRGGSGGTSEPKILISRNSLLDLQRNPSLVKKDPLLIYPKWLQLPSILVDNDTQRWEITPKASPKWFGNSSWPGPFYPCGFPDHLCFLVCWKNGAFGQVQLQCYFKKVHLQITWYNLTMFWLSL